MIGALVCLLLQSQQPLFTIAGSTNANLVQYDARVLSSGALDPKQPVVAYWIMLAQDGRHAELTGTEKRMAYGFTLMPDIRGCYRMTLQRTKVVRCASALTAVRLEWRWTLLGTIRCCRECSSVRGALDCLERQ